MKLITYSLTLIIAASASKSMEEFQNQLWGIGGAVVTAAILGGWSWFSSWRNDRVRLSVKLTQPGDLEVMEQIGCASMIVAVKSESTRVAKIKGAIVALQGVDLIPQFEKGFGASFNYVPVPGGPPPVLAIDLVPLSKPNSSDGFILERDDVARFAMPIQVPILHLFPKAPSQDVWIAVQYFDESEETVLRGLPIQNTIADLIAMWGDKIQTLKAPLIFNLRSTSKVLPGNPELMGKTNPNAVVFFPDDTPPDVRRQLEAKQHIISIGFPVYALMASDGSKTVMVQSPDGLLLPILTSKEIAEEYKRDSGLDVELKELPTLDELRKFVENPPTDSGGKLPPYKILLDSIESGTRKAGAIDRDGFLATMK